MSGAINVEYGVERARHLDRIAAKKGIRRNDLLRMMADEVIAADEAGRDAFAANVTMKIEPKDIPAVLTAFSTGLMEFDRIVKDVGKRDATHQRKVSADTANVSEARTTIVGDVRADNQRVLEAVLAAVEAARSDVVEGLVRFEKGLLEGIEKFGNSLAAEFLEAPRFASMDAKMDQVLAFAAEPRKETKIQVGDGYFSMPGFIGLVLGTGLLLGAPVILALAKLLGPPGVWVGFAMLGGGDPAICRSMRAEYANTRECIVRSTAGAVIATAIIPRNRR